LQNGYWPTHPWSSSNEAPTEVDGATNTVTSELTGAVAISSIWALTPIAEYASVLVLATIGVAGTFAEITVAVSDTGFQSASWTDPVG